MIGRFDTWLAAWSGATHPDAQLYKLINSKGLQNYGGYVNPVGDRATNQAREPFDVRGFTCGSAKTALPGC